jgi:hypothetical protein
MDMNYAGKFSILMKSIQTIFYYLLPTSIKELFLMAAPASKLLK